MPSSMPIAHLMQATTIQALDQKLTLAQKAEEAAKAAEQAASAAATKAQADAQEETRALQTQ